MATIVVDQRAAAKAAAARRVGNEGSLKEHPLKNLLSALNGPQGEQWGHIKEGADQFITLSGEKLFKFDQRGINKDGVYLVRSFDAVKERNLTADEFAQKIVSLPVVSERLKSAAA